MQLKKILNKKHQNHILIFHFTFQRADKKSHRSILAWTRSVRLQQIAVMQILNNDKQSLIKLLPVRGAGFDSTRVRDHLQRLCQTLVIESQSLRINFSSGTLIIFNHPAEMKARVIDMSLTDSMWGHSTSYLLLQQH